METVNSQIEASHSGQWTIRTRSGKEYPVRDIFQSIGKRIQKSMGLGDVAVAFDPARAGVPWAAIRFLVNTEVDEIEKYSSIYEGVEIVSELITRYQKFEKRELQGT